MHACILHCEKTGYDVYIDRKEMYKLYIAMGFCVDLDIVQHARCITVGIFVFLVYVVCTLWLMALACIFLQVH